MEETGLTPTLTPRAKRALGATYSWAYFTGFALFFIALLTLIRNGANLFAALRQYYAGFISYDRLLGFVTGLVFAALVFVALDCTLGWLALRYGNSLQTIKRLERPSADDIAAAIGAQQSYWRLQGVLMIVFIALTILGVALVFIGIVLARP